MINPLSLFRKPKVKQVNSIENLADLCKNDTIEIAPMTIRVLKPKVVDGVLCGSYEPQDVLQTRGIVKQVDRTGVDPVLVFWHYSQSKKYLYMRGYEYRADGTVRCMFDSAGADNYVKPVERKLRRAGFI